MAVMQKAYETKHHQAETSHWFLSARRHLIIKLLRSRQKNEKILEVGCASGVLLQALARQGFSSVYGAEISAEAINQCRERGLNNVTLIDSEQLPFPDGTFDVLISSDVLEHIDQDQKALADWCRVLKPGGVALLMVPAFQFLWSDHDVVNNHFRRYVKKELLAKMEQAGFTIVRSSYWNFFLFFPVSILRIVSRLRRRGKHAPKDQLYSFGPLNYFLEKLLRLENYLIIHGINFPWGISIMAVAAKAELFV